MKINIRGCYIERCSDNVLQDMFLRLKPRNSGKSLETSGCRQCTKKMSMVPNELPLDYFQIDCCSYRTEVYNICI